MNIDYRIVKFDPETHSVAVLWFSDTVPEAWIGNRLLLNHTLPIPTPSVEGLHELLEAYKPVVQKQLQVYEAVLDPNTDTSMSELIAAFPNAQVHEKAAPAEEPEHQGFERLDLEQKLYTAVCEREDAFAQALRYSSMKSLVSFDKSENAQWRYEAKAGMRFRDQLWLKYVEQVKLIYAADEDSLPTLESLVLQLPHLVYETPDVYPE